MERELLEKQVRLMEPMIKAVVELFKPFVEVAVHDLEKGTVVALYNNLSKRKVGDRSPIKELGVSTKEFPDFFPPYYKMNYDGKVMKCTSITLRDEKGEAHGLICFNVDTSSVKGLFDSLAVFLGNAREGKNPVESGGGSFEEKARALMDEFLQERAISSDHLGRDEKRELIQFLYSKGIFNYKKAPQEIASWLKVSRASIYNYIKEMEQ
ncbi:helix-turn-helix transcriptional regulator [Estrella lausannensis]|uniref:Uncharacterized protein n=1 Tax=Estrella lausannensis TaxID=483423 RepID=A0A0H5DT43_9BACT|nr:PAS domain-containing protein [Estrella lausannensis]CRX39528.1 hypothetical protein ELAC_2208 [Estrella lausannensis]